VALTLLLAAGCGDDDDDAAGSAGEQPAAEPASQGGDAFCRTRVDLEQAFASEQPDVAAVTTLLEQMEASAPAELAANAEGLATALAFAAETGGDPTGHPGFDENIGPIDEYIIDECGYAIVEVGAVDYAFTDLPETIPSGTTGLVLDNQGAEPHQMVVFRVADGVTATPQDLLALPEDEFGETLTSVGGVTAAPGMSGAIFSDLRPGRHIAVCFMPVGGGEDGPPHFTQGMVGEFEVT
jgi:hypothetical protein